MVLLNLPTVEALIDVPIFGGSGRTKMQRIESAYDYLLSRSDEIDLVNMSWGAPRRVQAIDRLHNELEQSGVNAIVASGNTDQQTGSPATAERAFSVAAVTEAVTEAGRMTRFSSPTDDVSALGRNIAVPKAPGTQMGPDLPEGHADTVIEEIGGDWVVVSGTSFAAPIALGYSGSLMTAHPQFFAAGEPDLQEHFERAFAAMAHDVTGTSEDGEGYIDFQAAQE
jgi:subtilisin